MYSKKISGKLLVVLLSLSIVAIMGMSGCSKKVTLEEVTDKDQNNTQTNTNTNTDTNTNTNTNTDTNTNTQNNNEQDVSLDGSNVDFININLIGANPPLQSKERPEAIFYFTKLQHPPEVENSFRYNTHNGWLIQLNDLPLHYGKKVKVQSIKKTGNVYDITVKLESGGDITKPAYGFFEVGIYDMPTSSKFRIYDDAGQKLWPKY